MKGWKQPANGWWWLQYVWLDSRRARRTEHPASQLAPDAGGRHRHAVFNYIVNRLFQMVPVILGVSLVGVLRHTWRRAIPSRS